MEVSQNINPSTELIQLITAEQAWFYRIFPKHQEINTLSFYIDESQPVPQIKTELRVLFGKSIETETIDPDIIQKLLSKHYRKSKSNGISKKVHFDETSTDGFLENLIEEAKEVGSSDIHIETYEDRCRVRIRIDGHLIERYVIEKTEYPALINKIKIKSNLDIAEKRLPQDGRIFYQRGNSKFDIRVSIIPTLHGEKVVMRLLSNDATNIELDKLGFNDQELESYKEGIKSPNGIILISGPTGSGKTTTLYATLKLLNQEKYNVVTVEDPIEYTLEGINQVQVKESIGLSFSSALRSFLRQDPDVIMLGEIRDAETAEMAIQAALTGHLVLSTIHTNSAWGTISRLIDMGVPSYLLASTLNTSVAQRLVRKLCSCKEEKTFDEAILPKKFKAPYLPDTYNIAVGCEDCYYTGYKGRIALYEIIPIHGELATKIRNKEFEIAQYLTEHEIKTLQDNAFDRLAKGETSIEEVYPLLISGN